MILWTRCVREGVANFRTSGVRGVLLLVVGTIAFSSALLGEMFMIRSILDEQHRFVSAGGTAVLVDGPASSTACDAVARERAVVASGGYRAVPDTWVSIRSDAGDATVTVATPGFVDVLHVLDAVTPNRSLLGDTDGATVYVSRAVAENQGITPSPTGIDLELSGQHPTRVRAAIAGLLDLGRVAPSVAGSVVMVAGREAELDACLIVMRPGSQDRIDALVAEVTPLQVGRTRAVHRLVTQGGFSEDPFESMTVRVTRWLWVLASLGATVLWSVTLAFRSAEVGLYRSVGLSRGAIAMIRTAEGIALLWATLLVTWVAVAVVGGRAAVLRFVYSTSVGWEMLGMACVGSAATLVAASLSAAIGSPAALVKDR